jgi:hypothetical protein
MSEIGLMTGRLIVFGARDEGEEYTRRLKHKQFRMKQEEAWLQVLNH